MAEFHDLMQTRREADVAAYLAEHDAKKTDHDALLGAVLAVRLELRALGMVIDYVGGKNL